jgi:hypothetical protein
MIFTTPQIANPQAGDKTAQVDAYVKNVDGSYTHYEWEGAREDVEAACIELLAIAEQVSVKYWIHSHNLPNALPLVKANICGLDNAKLDDSGALVFKSVDIW